MQAALAFDLFWIFRGAKKGVSDHGDGGNGSATHREHEFPIRRQCNQRDDSVVCEEFVQALAGLKTGYICRS
jgi:hypothetical protein